MALRAVGTVIKAGYGNVEDTYFLRVQFIHPILGREVMRIIPVDRQHYQKYGHIGMQVPIKAYGFVSSPGRAWVIDE